jgi:glycosyltransferase involved in cell wall biosynthesis
VKIGIDIRNIGKKRTGDEVVFFNLTKNLAQIDAQNEYFLYTDLTDPVVLKEITERLEIQDKRNFQIISLKTKNRFTWNFWTLQKYLRAHPVDVYLTQYITPFFVPTKIKILTIIHDISFKVYAKYIKFSDLFFLKILMPLSFRRADKIIGVSDFTAQEILKYYNVAEDKVTWIHNAVGDNFLAEISETQVADVKKKYNLPEKFILYVGTLQPRKNLPTLIEAYAKLPTETQAAIKLVLAGGRGHNYDTNIDKTIAKHSLQNNVFLPGFISEDDKPGIFKSSLLFCNPSFYEGFGITVLEAMTLGMPVIASDIPPHREVAGDSIVFFNPERSADLTDRLNNVINDTVMHANLAQKELIQAKNFLWKNTVRKLLEIFNNLND